MDKFGIKCDITINNEEDFSKIERQMIIDLGSRNFTKTIKAIVENTNFTTKDILSVEGYNRPSLSCTVYLTEEAYNTLEKAKLNSSQN